MDTKRYTRSMPIKDILNSNPAWVRYDLGDLTALARSLDEEGMKLPVLVSPSLLVIDGARRIVAADKIGWTEVPVSIATKWEVALAHFKKARELEAQGYLTMPRRWFETVDLSGRVLREAYLSRRSELLNERRLKNKQLRDRGIEPPEPGAAEKLSFVKAVSEALGMDMSTLRALQDISAAVRKCAAISDELGKFAAKLADGIDEGRVGAYTVHGVLREAARGNYTVEELALLEWGPTGRLKRRRVTDLPPRSNRPPRQSQRSVTVLQTAGRDLILRLTDVVEQLGQQASNYGSISTEFDPAEAASTLSRLSSALRRIGKLRGYLDAYVQTSTEREQS